MLLFSLLLLVEKCMSLMQTGTQMVKLRGGSKGLVRYFYVDEHKSCIRWRPSRKNERAKSKWLFPFSHFKHANRSECIKCSRNSTDSLTLCFPILIVFCLFADKTFQMQEGQVQPYLSLFLHQILAPKQGLHIFCVLKRLFNGYPSSS